MLRSCVGSATCDIRCDQSPWCAARARPISVVTLSRGYTAAITTVRSEVWESERVVSVVQCAPATAIRSKAVALATNLISSARPSRKTSNILASTHTALASKSVVGVIEANTLILVQCHVPVNYCGAIHNSHAIPSQYLGSDLGLCISHSGQSSLANSLSVITTSWIGCSAELHASNTAAARLAESVSLKAPALV